MRVSRIDLTTYTGTTATAHTCARRTWVHRSGMLLQISDTDGHTGLGEASPLPGISRESLEDTSRDLLLFSRSRSLPNMETLSDITAFCDSPPHSGVTASARFAIETALSDLLSRRSRSSFWQTLGGTGEIDAIALNALVNLDASPDTILSLLQKDVTTFKVKIGHRGMTIAEEMRLLRRLRNTIGPNAEIRLDANGVFSPDEARYRMDQYALIAPAFIEEPVTGRDLLMLKNPPFPVLADESLLDGDLTEDILSSDIIGGIVIKPALHGGLSVSRKLAIRAIHGGKTVILTHLFDGPIALRAASGLAFSLPAAPAPCGLMSHSGLTIWPPMTDAARYEKGILSRQDDPGICTETYPPTKGPRWTA